MRGRRSAIVIGAAVGGLLVSATAAVPASAQATQNKGGGSTAPVPVVRKLNNPRQLALTTGESLLVAEAGRGGSTCFGAPDEQTCVGLTSAVAWVRAPKVQTQSNPVRIVRGMISAAGPDGSFAVGADGVSARSLGKIYSIETFAPPEVQLPPDIDRSQLGKLLRSHPFGEPRAIADVSAFEIANDPDEQGVDSNPYAVLDLGKRVLIADAAGNSILQYRNGRLSLFAVLPNIQTGGCAGQPNDAGTTGCDAVPTGLAEGPDGSIYVSGLGAEVPGAGRVWKLDRHTGAIKRTWGDLTAVTGVAVGKDGSVYASQLFTTIGDEGPDITSGKLTRIKRNGARSDVAVPLPAGIAVDRRNNVYVSAWSTSTETGSFGPNSDGQVWRLRF